MNLEESNSFVEQMEKNNKKKKTVIITLIVCAILIVILLGVIMYMKYLDSLKLKVFINGNQVNFSDKFFAEEDNIKYINVKELANMLGYSYQKGEYKNYTEDSNSCYLRTDYEIVSMSADSNTVTKYILNENESDKENKSNNSSTSTENTVSSELIITNEETGEQYLNIVVDSKNETFETIYIQEPIKYINDELYVSYNEVSKLFNINLNVSDENRVRIYSLENLIVSADKYAKNLGYKELSNIYENLTALSGYMMVVGDGENYGVVDITTGNELISLKYEKIVYMQNTDEFLVTAEGSVGIVSKTGETIIKPTEYDNISILDEINKLYLVEKDDKYGVLDKDGEIIVHCEYDSIGIDDWENFQNEDIRNFGLLFDEVIPVNVDGKTGLIDINGNEIFKPIYTLGYVANLEGTSGDENSSSSTSSSTSNTTNTTNTTNSINENITTIAEHDNVLTIDESTGIKGIVLKNYNNLYGIYDVKSKGFIPCSFTRIYSRTKAGVKTYYLEYDESEIELTDYLMESEFLNSTNDLDSGNEEGSDITESGYEETE